MGIIPLPILIKGTKTHMIMYKTTHCIDYTQIIQNYILLTWKYSKNIGGFWVSNFIIEDGRGFVFLFSPS